MNDLFSFKKKEDVKQLLELIKRKAQHEWSIMEICGGQTHAIAKYRLEELLPQNIHLLHGPGCPVCVTPEHIIEKAIIISKNSDVIFTTFGDMMRVPGYSESLSQAKAQGADIRMVYSPLDAIKIAMENSQRIVVFFGIGFETTAPIHALTILRASSLGLLNFCVLTSLFLVPPAIELLKQDPDNRIDAFLAAGHVCAVMGYQEYDNIAKNYKIPICVTGFEPVDILWGIYNCIDMLENKNYTTYNAYSRIVTKEGNRKAQLDIYKVFEKTTQPWRGIGEIPNSGLQIRPEYELYNALQRFKTNSIKQEYITSCISGEILRGKMQPNACPNFGKKCTPEHPLGVSMVSSEGACAAFFRYHLK